MVTIFKNFHTPSGDRTLLEALRQIRQGQYKPEITHLREVLQDGKKQKYDKLKRTMPAFTPCGTFKDRRTLKHLAAYNQFIILDIDNISSSPGKIVNKMAVDQLKHQAESIEYTYSCFISPSGKGMKILVKANSTHQYHQLAFNQVKDHYEKELHIEIDKSGKDISRLCFFSYDPDLYLNKEAKIFSPPLGEPEGVFSPSTMEPQTAHREALPTKEDNQTDTPNHIEVFQQCIQFTEKKESFKEGNRNNFIYLLANNCNRKGIPYDKALQLITYAYDYDISEITTSVKSAYANNHNEYKKDSGATLPLRGSRRGSDYIYTAQELLALDSTKDRYLLDPILPAIGTAVIVGKPDSGKSQMARQLALCIANGNKTFLSLPLNIQHKKVIFLATEDDRFNTKFLLENQYKGLSFTPNKNLTFIFADVLSQDEILHDLEKQLQNNPVDIIIIDCFGDVFKGLDANNNMMMRNTVKPFDCLAKKHNTLVLFIHHINKGAYDSIPDQKHIQGGSGLVQKVRCALQLVNGESNYKYLTVTKGNYCPREYKEKAMELTFDESTFTFAETGTQIPLEDLDQTKPKSAEDEKTQYFINLAEAIFDGKKTLSYAALCKEIEIATDKGIASAKRYIRHLTDLSIIEKDKSTKKYQLVDTSQPAGKSRQQIDLEI